MPASTFNIAANADDGFGWFTQTGISTNTGFGNNANDARVNYATAGAGAYVSKFGGWFRFSGITIPQGSIINSATLRVYGMAENGAIAVKFEADSRQTPGNPTNRTQVMSPANVLASSVTDSWATTGTYTGKAKYLQRDQDVQALVQSLVNSRGYNSGEMVFYANGVKIVQIGGLPFARIYNRDWGATTTTGQGGMPKSAKLVIDYTSSVPPDQTTFHHG